MVNRRAFLSLFLAMFFLLGCQPKEVRYIPYHNERFGFELVYPSFMAMDPPPENGDGISCRGRGLELNAYGSMDLTWMDLYDTGLGTRDLYPEDEVFYEQRVVDSEGMVHCRKSARFPGTDNGNVFLTLELTYPEGEIDVAAVDSIMKSFRYANFPTFTVSHYGQEGQVGKFFAPKGLKNETLADMISNCYFCDI